MDNTVTALHILLVEDVTSDAMLIERVVRKAFPNCSFLCVGVREEYLRALKDFKPDFILSDYELPRFDGLSALKLACQRAPEVPFILVTDSNSEETAAECIRAGAWDYVLKEHLQRLGMAMHRSLEQRKLRRERRQALLALHESEERYRHIVENAPAGIGVQVEDGIVFMNQAGLKILGADDRSQVIGKPLGAFVSPEAFPAAAERLQRSLAGEHVAYPAEAVYIKTDGTSVDVEVTAKPLLLGNRQALQFILTDITERKKAEQEREKLREALYREKVYLSSLIQNANVPIIIWTSDLIVTEFNHSFEQLTGLKREDMLGLRVDQTTYAVENEMALKCILETRKGKNWHNVEIPVKGKSGEVKTLLWNSATIRDSGGCFIATIVQGTDITERKRAEETNLYLSYHDHLTDIYNRRYFEHRLKETDDESLLPLTVVMGDLNGLKLVNDSFGHEAGDELLKRAAQAVKRGCPDDAVVARIGGDEFGIILTNTDAEKAEKIIGRIKEIAAADDFDKAPLSISLGYATAYRLNRKLDALMMEAENYMYRHKMYESASMRSKTIDVIMNALYEKSARELQHSQRVSALAAALAEKLGFTPDDVNKIRMSGLVHDIGKIGISEKILNKPGRLDDDEWAFIKKHPEAGWRILSSAREFSDLAKSSLYHHERWDGAGYPEGLVGEQIPIEARIIAVADAYDAMISERPYRQPLKPEEAALELTRASGKQFDPGIVDVFVRKVLKKDAK